MQAHVFALLGRSFDVGPRKRTVRVSAFTGRDVEMALRIKELLYEDQYTIAGAKKGLAMICVR